jgi:hypothetical protein
MPEEKKQGFHLSFVQACVDDLGLHRCSPGRSHHYQQRQGGAKNLLPKKNMKNGIGSSNTTKDKKLGKK